MKNLIIAITLIAILAGGVFAQDAESFLVSVTRDGSGVVITGYGGSTRDVRVPANIQGLPVKEIGARAFRTSKITSIVIPEGVSVIGDAAFQTSESLHTVQLPNSLRKIGRDAFQGCKVLNTINLPNGITEIGVSAFANTAVKTVTWPTGASEISEYTFRECALLESVKLPEGLVTIGNGAFYRCAALVNIAIPSTVRNIYNLSFDGCKSVNLADQVAIKRAGYRGNF